tara:strand:+ start:191 stop:400 length:210 start_codon:yes stop_codon:yes gene_type:complete
MKKKFKELMIGQVFDYELLFEGQFVKGIKKSSRTALICLDKNEKNDFIINMGMNEKVYETNVVYAPFTK